MHWNLQPHWAAATLHTASLHTGRLTVLNPPWDSERLGWSSDELDRRGLFVGSHRLLNGMPLGARRAPRAAPSQAIAPEARGRPTAHMSAHARATRAHAARAAALCTYGGLLALVPPPVRTCTPTASPGARPLPDPHEQPLRPPLHNQELQRRRQLPDAVGELRQHRDGRGRG